MIITSYIDPRFIAIVLYFLYLIVSLASMIALLIYLPGFLKKEEKERRTRFAYKDYLKDLSEKIEMSKKSKYYRAMIAQQLLKGFASKSGYISLTLNEIMELVKDGKIEIPSEIKPFLTESLMFYSTFKSFSQGDKSVIERIIEKLFHKEEPEKMLTRSIEILYDIYNQ